MPDDDPATCAQRGVVRIGQAAAKSRNAARCVRQIARRFVT
jgi:hypothetical protein